MGEDVDDYDIDPIVETGSSSSTSQEDINVDELDREAELALSLLESEFTAAQVDDYSVEWEGSRTVVEQWSDSSGEMEVLAEYWTRRLESASSIADVEAARIE